MSMNFLSTQLTNLQTAAVNRAGELTAQSFDPGVTVQSDAPFIEPLRTAAGWGIALGIVFMVLTVIIGAILLAVGKISNTPGNQSNGFKVIMWSLICSAIIAGASGLVFFFTTISLGTGGAAPGSIG